MPENGFYGFPCAQSEPARDFRASGKPGATAGADLAGGTIAGAPTSGYHKAGEFIVDQAAGTLWICTAAGLPGTWTQVVGGSGSYTLPDATTTAIGGLEVDQAPSSGHPVALSQERLDAPWGTAPLDGDRSVPSFGLPPLGTATATAEASRWTRQGTVLAPTQAWEATDTQEPTVFYEDGSFVMYYSANNFSAAAIGRATSTDGVTWTKYSSNPVIGQGGSGISGWAAQPTVVHIQGVWRCYYAEGSSTGKLRVATSADGLSFTRNATACLSTGGGVTQWANSAVWLEGTNSWKMLIEGLTGSIWEIYLATSTDGVSFTLANGGSPLTTLQVHSGGSFGGPWVPHGVQKRNGLYHVWLHAAPGTGGLPTDIYHFSSADLITWTMVGSGAVLTHAGTDPDFDQLADPCVLEAGGSSYLYASGVHNASSTGRTILWTIAAPLAMVVDAQAPLAGAVTSVALSMPAEFSVSGSPVTGASTISVSKATEAANSVYAGPSNGSAAAPTFRALSLADVPYQASSLLVLLPNPYNFVDDSATDNGQPPDFIMTAAGDVIGVGGL